MHMLYVHVYVHVYVFFFEKKPGQFYLQIKMYSVCIYLLVYNQELSVNALNLLELSFF